MPLPKYYYQKIVKETKAVLLEDIFLRKIYLFICKWIIFMLLTIVTRKKIIYAIITIKENNFSIKKIKNITFYYVFRI